MNAILVESASQPGTFHVVSDSPLLCTCAGFHHRGTCKHTRALAATLAACPSCGSHLSRVDGTVACDGCEWAAVAQ